MTHHDNPSDQDLTHRIDECKATGCPKAARLLHDLQTHQIELEMQNRELRESQLALEEARDRYADLYDFAPVGYLTLDESGRVLEANLTAAALLGRERGRVVGKPFFTWLAAGEGEAFFGHLRQVFHTIGNAFVELKVKVADGIHDVRLESTAACQAPEKTCSCRSVMIDITGQKRLATQVTRDFFRLEALFNTIPAMAYYKDMDLRFINVSAACTAFFNVSRSEMIGRKISEVAPSIFTEDCERDDRAVLETGQANLNQEMEMENGVGNRVWLSTSKAPFFGPDGKIAGLVGVALDVTRLREAEHQARALTQENRRLTRRMFAVQEDERRRIARELHDELGQWLTAVQTEAQAIMSLAVSNEKRSGMKKSVASAKAIDYSASEMHQVLRRILRRLRPATLDQLGLEDSLRELVRQWGTQHPDVACNLRLDGPLEGLAETLNISLYRIVQEALANVSRHAADASRFNIALSHEADGIQLSLEDDGKGMDPRQPRQGLGLLGMRERVIAANGIFTLHSAPGRGLHIQIKLPFTQPEEDNANFQQEK
ncbi:MAG: PAS domain-containing protein [Sulfuricella sp.]|nr:PAS domain-containing protein [Sulfuricella sp.]